MKRNETVAEPIRLARTIMSTAGKPVLDFFDSAAEDHKDPLIKFITQAIFGAAVDCTGHEAYYRAADALQKASEELIAMATRLYDAGDDTNPEMKNG